LLWKIQPAIDECMTVVLNIGSKDPDLAVADLARETSVLPRHSARRLALLEKASLVDHEDRLVICQMLDDIIAEDIAKRLSIPIPAAQDRLLPSPASNRSCLAHLRADLPETSLHSSQHALAQTTDVSAS